MGNSNLISEENELRKLAIQKAIGRQQEALLKEDYFSLLSACQEVDIITRVFVEDWRRETNRYLEKCSKNKVDMAFLNGID